MNWVSLRLALLLASGWLAVSAAPTAPSIWQSERASWKSVPEDLALEYPRDHGAHPEYQTEWWYLTGQVEDPKGARYGYQVTVFRNGLVAGEPAPEASRLRARELFIGHLAVTDITAGRTHFAERSRRGGTPLGQASELDLELALENWSLVREPAAQTAEGSTPERLRVRAADAATGIALDLTLEPQKPLVLHGRSGYSAKGSEPGNASAYASWTRLATRGRLVVAGAEHAVSGSSWFDHEHGSSVLGQGVCGWDWFGLQLDDGRELMLFGLRREDGTLTLSSAATLVAPASTPGAMGSSRSLGAEEFSLSVRSRWKSPTTAADYPASWTIRIPSEGLELQVDALVPDCELNSVTTAGVIYWEGPVEVSGTHSGRGYAELTGYAGSLAGRF